MLGISWTSTLSPECLKLIWTNCTGGLPPALQCSQIEVPTCWEDPNSTSINLTLLKLPATGDKSRRLGSLFYQDGVPGIPTSLDMIAFAKEQPLFSPTILEHFDIVAQDPRGVGMNSAVTCDPTLGNGRVPLFPKTQQEYFKTVAHCSSLGQSYLNLTGPELKCLDTST